MSKELNIWEKKVLAELTSTEFKGEPVIEFVKKLLVDRDLSNDQIANTLTNLCYDGVLQLTEDATSPQTQYDLLLGAHFQDLHENGHFRRKIGARIRMLREEKGWSQKELAARTGLQQQNVARIESGKYSTGQDILSQIATALGKELKIE